MALALTAKWDKDKQEPTIMPFIKVWPRKQEQDVVVYAGYGNNKQEMQVRGNLILSITGYIIEACFVIKEDNNTHSLLSIIPMWLDPKAVISINTNTDEDKDVGEISSGEFPATCILKGGNERGNEESFYWFKRTGDSVFIKFSNGRQYELVWRRNLDWKSFLIRRMIAEFIPVQTEEEE